MVTALNIFILIVDVALLKRSTCDHCAAERADAAKVFLQLAEPWFL
jgi:hypothetical protein